MAEVENSTAQPPQSSFLPIIRSEELQNGRISSSSPEPNCAICLGNLKNNSYTDSCLHQFCFSCILKWSKIKRECPLCKQNFNSIIHNVRSENDYDQCHVEAEPQDSTLQHPYLEPDIPIARNGELYIPLSERRSLNFRQRVYREILHSAVLRNRTGIPRESSPEFYRNNPSELCRLVPFIKRELEVLLPLSSYLFFNHTLQTITHELERSNIRSYLFYNSCRNFLGNIRCHIFTHELWNFATSGYDVVGYDRNVKYYPRPEIDVTGFDQPIRPGLEYFWTSIINSPRRERSNDVRIVEEIQMDLSVSLHENSSNNVSEIVEIEPQEVDVLTISDSSSDECEIIREIRPADRVYEIIELSSGEEESSSSNDRNSESLDLIEISESSLSRSSETLDSNERTENGQALNQAFNLPSTSYKRYDSSSESESDSKCKLISFKRYPSSDADSDSTTDYDTKDRIRRKRRRSHDDRKLYYAKSSESDIDEDSNSNYRAKRSRKNQSTRHHKSSSDNSSDRHRKRRARSPSSSESEEKERKRKSKKSKRERHRDSSSSRKDRKSSKDKKSKRRKKHKDSKHKKSEKR